jgi:hypothetical protein
LKSRQWISAIQRAGEGSNWEMTVKNGFGANWVAMLARNPTCAQFTLPFVASHH